MRIAITSPHWDVVDPGDALVAVRRDSHRLHTGRDYGRCEPPRASKLLSCDVRHDVAVSGSRLEPDHAEQILLANGFIVLESRAAACPLITRLGRESEVVALAPRAATGELGWSHSNRYGFGAFPWHTDCALDNLPPRWMVLECETAEGRTSTELLDPGPDLLRRMKRCVMRVRSRSGHIRHLPAASPIGEGRFRLRWDPRVCDSSDTELDGLLGRQSPTAAYEWVRGRLVVVDNWRLLHRRPAVEPTETRRLLRSYVRAG